MAIKNTELRIGNWVAMGARPTKVVAIRQRTVETEKAMMSLKSLEGESLTPAIFQRMDVADAGNGFYSFTIEGFDYSFIHHRCMDSEGCSLQTYDMLYVHQLQNFYFAKTGKELEINFDNFSNQ